MKGVKMEEEFNVWRWIDACFYMGYKQWIVQMRREGKYGPTLDYAIQMHYNINEMNLQGYGGC